MLLSITTNTSNAGDIGFLFHKHPARFQSFDLSYGQAHVFYPVAQEQSCTVCLLLEIDPVRMARGRKRKSDQMLARYVNDRPFVVSSFMSSAISKVFGSAMSGTCKHRPDLVEFEFPLQIQLEVLPIKGGPAIAERLFEPLGYQVQIERQQLDSQFSEWGDSRYYSVRLENTLTLNQLLTHLYVLIPVFDDYKHYFIGSDEYDKLLSKGQGWLANHPERELIARRYLKFQSGLAKDALATLQAEQNVDSLDDDQAATKPNTSANHVESELEKPISLNQLRLEAVHHQLQNCGAQRVIDLGCGEGNLLQLLVKDRQFTEIKGMDVSIKSLEIATKRLRLDQLPDNQRQRIDLIHGSLMYHDRRFHGFDAAAIVEVVEHLDRPRLQAFQRVVFQYARPRCVVLTTPNSEYNVLWDSLPAGQFRHPDHRFEWTRRQFQDWAAMICDLYRYTVDFVDVGPQHQTHGSPTQMAVFSIVERAE